MKSNLRLQFHKFKCGFSRESQRQSNLFKEVCSWTIGKLNSKIVMTKKQFFLFTLGEHR